MALSFRCTSVMFRLLKVATFLVLIQGCRKNAESSSVTSFWSPNLAVSRETEARLSVIDEHPVFKDINYKAFRYLSPKPYEPQGTEEFVDFEFRDLTESQFNFLKNHFGRGLSKVTLVDGETYFLTDFLQPPIAAVSNKFFLSEMYIDNGYLRFLESNCLNTAYEFLLGREEIFSAYLHTDREAFLSELFNNGEGFVVPSSDDTTIKNPNIQLGDVLLVFIDGVLQHAAIVLDKGVWFEKTGNGSDFGFKITLDPSFSPEENPTYKHVRVAKPDRLRAPEQVFKKSPGINCKSGQLALFDSLVIGTFTVGFAPSGKAHLTPESYRPTVGKHVNYYDYRDRPEGMFQAICTDLH